MGMGMGPVAVGLAWDWAPGGEGATMYGGLWLYCGADSSGAEARLALAAAVDGFLRIMSAGNDLARLDILRAG